MITAIMGLGMMGAEPWQMVRNRGLVESVRHRRLSKRRRNSGQPRAVQRGAGGLERDLGAGAGGRTHLPRNRTWPRSVDGADRGHRAPPL